MLATRRTLKAAKRLATSEAAKRKERGFSNPAVKVVHCRADGSNEFVILPEEVTYNAGCTDTVFVAR